MRCLWGNAISLPSYLPVGDGPGLSKIVLPMFTETLPRLAWHQLLAQSLPAEQYYRVSLLLVLISRTGTAKNE